MELSKKWELAIFDMDGTILDTLDDLTAAINVALSRCGYPERSRDEVRRFVGNGIRKLAERSVPAGTPDEEVEKVYQACASYYRDHNCIQTKPYPGIPDLLKNLKEHGYLLAVVSNKTDSAVQDLCRQYFESLFDYAIGAREGIQKKPAPDSVYAAMEALHTKSAIYIGDSDVDLETAANAGLDCLAVTWGFRDRPLLMQRGAKHFADTAEDVLHFLL